MASGKSKKNSGNDEFKPQVSLSNKKATKSLKAEPKIVKKSLNQNSERVKELKTTLNVQARNENEKTTIKRGKRESNNSERDGEGNLSSPHGSKEKEIVNEKHEKMSRRGQKAEGNLGGLILMCNAKTKSDCFRYHVMGVPTNKQEIVMGIKPGLKLFLFDFDLKLLYGIYEAASAGGMKLEPAAFGGAFPVQVRFKVHKDCFPLPESVFKKAIEDNYDERTHKFKTELTVEQVKKLIEMFRPAPFLHSNAQPSVHQALAAPNLCIPPAATIPAEEARKGQFYRDPYISNKGTWDLMLDDHARKQFSKHPVSPSDVASRSLFFPTEKEYRSYGLRGERHNLTAATTSIGHTVDPYRIDQEGEQLLRSPASMSGNVRPDALFLSEKEYRTYGLKGRLEQSTSMPPTKENNPALKDYPRHPYNPYQYSTTSLVDRCLLLPSSMTAPSESFSPTGRETFINDSNHVRNQLGRVVPNEGERLYSGYASNALSDYNQKYHHLGGEPEFKSTPVSSRYSFAGPSASYH